MDKSQKESLVVKLTSLLEGASIAICANYQGLKVEELNTVRRKAEEVGSEVKVVKNTLTRIALKNVVEEDSRNSEFDSFYDTFVGPSLVVFGKDDAVSSAKFFVEAVEAYASLVAKGVFLDGKFLDSKELEALSKMPGKQELYGQLLALMQAPATQLVKLMNEPGRQIAVCINEQAKKLG